MCYFLTVAVPDRSRDLMSGMEAAGFIVWENTNPSVRAVLPPNTVPFWVTDGHCSCALEPRRWKAFDEARERARYEKRGWSRAKIDKAISAKRPLGPPEPLGRLHEGLRKLVDRAGSVYLFGHFYSGDQTIETVTAGTQQRVTFGDFLASRGHYPEDTVVLLRAG